MPRLVSPGQPTALNNKMVVRGGYAYYELHGRNLEQTFAFL
jgi:hypothetical protein